MMGGQTNEWMEMQCMCIDIQKRIIFQKILGFLPKHYGRTDQRNDQPTDQRTDKSSYVMLQATSKKDFQLKNVHIICIQCIGFDRMNVYFLRDKPHDFQGHDPLYSLSKMRKIWRWRTVGK